MKRLNAWLKDYFDMHRSERNGMLILLSIIFVLIIAQYFLHFFIKPAQQDFTEIAQLAEKFRQNSLAMGFNEPEQMPGLIDLEKPAENFQLFKFDPNKLTEEGFQRLGLPHYTARNIIKYRQKGGKFKRAEDFKRIYGLSEEKYFELLPYIDLPKNVSGNNYEENKFDAAENKPVAAKIVNLNTADSIDLLEVRGIGPAFASRIIKFRNALGGFKNKEQLREIYGIDSQKFETIAPQLIVNESSVKFIDLNSADYNTLNMHPYISSKHANLIIQYRRKHGNFKSVEEIKNIYGIDEKSFARMREYLKVE